MERKGSFMKLHLAAIIINKSLDIFYVDDDGICMYVCALRSDSDSMSERCFSPSFPPLLSTNTSLDSTMLAATDLS